MEKACCGLRSNAGEVPLKGVSIEARLSGLCSEVSVSQRFRNEASMDVEAVYVFPLEEGSAISGFEARIGDRIIKGRVESRDDAFEVYDDAMEAGHGAFLLDQERPNIFTASVGNLKPGQEVVIRVSYVAMLRFEGDAIRMMIPTTVSPRYVPSSQTPEVGQPDGERVNPEKWLEVPYGMSLSVEVAMGSPLKAVESPSHSIRTALSGQSATVTLSQRETAMDRDFVLLVETESLGPDCRVAQQDDGTRVAMVTFRPRPEDLGGEGRCEVLFLLDCSGSMRGTSIAEARRALALCLRTLSEGDTFNVIRFGSSFTSLWKTPRPYAQGTLDEATAYLEHVGADLGGTEILSPLRAIAASPPPSDRTRQVLLLTDGEVSNESAVIALCQAQAASTRVFAFGIGAGASEHLVRGVARASRGAAEFIAPGERIEPKVLRMARRVRTPSLTDLRVDWGAMSVSQAPATPPPVFGGDVVTIFGRIEAGRATEVTLRAGERAWKASVDFEKAEKAGPVPTLWARHRIQDLETKRDGSGRSGSNQRRPGRADKLNAQIVELGKAYGLMSSQTSYVAIEERTLDERSTGQAQLRRVPVALTKDWGGLQRDRAMSMSSPLAFAPMDSMELMMNAPAAPSPPGGMPRPAAMKGGAPPKAKKAQTRRRARRAPVETASEAEKTRGQQYFSAPEPEPCSQEDLLFNLLMTQKADGHFTVSNALLAILGHRAGRLRGTDDSAITALVVALLRQEFPADQGVWAAAVTKAERWLASNPPTTDISSVL